ncbi:hypothetical protein DFP95_103215 [Cohnella lupini]|uniref:Uncharacterized protein n=1 Tax=Cohnella lupini TaxID=1294267 RepID=A0A3D9IQA2_9BACL|nr:hypothetical protein DFP95_103215 [Cohnella lupini]
MGVTRPVHTPFSYRKVVAIMPSILVLLDTAPEKALL